MNDREIETKGPVIGRFSRVNSIGKTEIHF